MSAANGCPHSLPSLANKNQAKCRRPSLNITSAVTAVSPSLLEQRPPHTQPCSHTSRAVVKGRMASMTCTSVTRKLPNLRPGCPWPQTLKMYPFPRRNDLALPKTCHSQTPRRNSPIGGRVNKTRKSHSTSPFRGKPKFHNLRRQAARRQERVFRVIFSQDAPQFTASYNDGEQNPILGSAPLNAAGGNSHVAQIIFPRYDRRFSAKQQ